VSGNRYAGQNHHEARCCCPNGNAAPSARKKGSQRSPGRDGVRLEIMVNPPPHLRTQTRRRLNHLEVIQRTPKHFQIFDLAPAGGAIG
jgi:hypothetical protein